MAKNKKDATGAPDGDSGKRDERRLRRLEERLIETRRLEAKRLRQAEKARERGARLESKIAGLQPVATESAGAPRRTRSRKGAAGPSAFCMREKRVVVILEPRAIVMRNGRAAVSGTCPDCGARVVTTAAAAIRSLGAATPG